MRFNRALFKEARFKRARLKDATLPILLLLAIVITACTGVVEFIDPDDPPADASSPAAAINAAAGQAAEEATAVGENVAEAKTTGDETAPSPAETTTAELPPTVAPAEPLAAKAPQTNRRVEVPDDLRVNWLIPWDGILPIYRPEFVSVEQSPFEDDELIIGVAWDGEAKAYPISVLRSREMVNDELAGIPTLVTW